MVSLIRTRKKSTAAHRKLRVEHGEKMKDVVQRLLKIVRSRGVKTRYLLLDKGFFSVKVITYLKRAGVGFIIPAMVRGRKPKGRKKTTGLRSIRNKTTKNQTPESPCGFASNTAAWGLFSQSHG